MEWISVEDKLPELNAFCFCYVESLKLRCFANYLGKDGWFYLLPENGFNYVMTSGLPDSGQQIEVSHWQEKPEPPKE